MKTFLPLYSQSFYWLRSVSSVNPSEVIFCVSLKLKIYDGEGPCMCKVSRWYAGKSWPCLDGWKTIHRDVEFLVCFMHVYVSCDWYHVIHTTPLCKVLSELNRISGWFLSCCCMDPFWGSRSDESCLCSCVVVRQTQQSTISSPLHQREVFI